MAEKTLEELVQWSDAYEQATVTARLESERDRDYYDHRQWTAEERAVLEKRGQPVLTFNRIAPKIDFVLGTERRTRTDPKAFPRTPQEDEAADVVTEVIRYVCDANKWDQERSAAYENMLIEGTGAAEVRVETKGDKVLIVVEHVPWDRIFWDPRSRYADFRDAKYYGTVVWMDFEDAIEKWPGAKDVLEMSLSTTGSQFSDTLEDRPRWGVWSETVRARARIKVCHMYYRVGELWYVCTFTKSGFLEAPRASPYTDEYGAPEPALFLQSAKVDRENSRYGIVRGLISPQDEINKRRSKSLHLLNTHQVVAEKGAVDSPREAMQQLAKPDGFVEVTPGLKFEIVPTTEMATGHFKLLADAKAEIDAVGANAALTGKDPREQSGVAIQARQQGGFIELEPLFDNMRAWSLRVYKAIWHRVRQYWTHEMYLRVTDSDEHMRFIPMNKPVQLRDALMKRGISQQEMMAFEQEQIQRQQMAMLGGPMGPQAVDLDQVVGYQNHVAYLDMDIILDETPDTVTLQQEQFAQLAQMAGSGVQIPPDVLIEASSLRNKKALLQRMRSGGATPEQQQAAAAEQQQAKAMQFAAADLELQQKSADVKKTQAEVVKITTDAGVAMDKAAREAANDAVERFGQQPEMGSNRQPLERSLGQP